jgi:phosphoglycerate dehydrogenase-like enzyme
MRILIGSLNFPSILPILGGLLPDDEIMPCPEERLAAQAKSAEVLIPTMAPIGREIIAGSSLRLIQQWGVGLEGVDLQAAGEENIAVCNVPADKTPGNALSTAEQALFLMMAVARRFNTSRGHLGVEPWGAPMGRALFDQEALVVGLGAVGKALAKRLIGMSMKVSAVKAHPDPELASELGLAALGGPDDLFDMMGRADFVVSCLTATKQTIGLFNARAFKAMKQNAIFVNVGRGKVVEEADLLVALDGGHLGGAGLDVFFSEPVDPKSPLLNHAGVVAMPHTGGVTEQSFGEIARQVAANIERLRAGEPLKHQAKLI